jgi:ribosomal protein L30E
MNNKGSKGDNMRKSGNKSSNMPARAHHSSSKNTGNNIKNTGSNNNNNNITKIKTCGPGEKDACLLRLREAARVGLRRGRDVYVGFNSVMKLISSGRAIAVVSFRDTNSNVFNALKDAAECQSIPIAAFSRVSAEFATVLGVKKLSCFGIPFASNIEDSDTTLKGKDCNEEENDSHALSVALDEMRDFIVQLGKISRHVVNSGS